MNNHHHGDTGFTETLIIALDAAALNPDVPKFSVGVLQT